MKFLVFGLCVFYSMALGADFPTDQVVSKILHSEEINGTVQKFQALNWARDQLGGLVFNPFQPSQLPFSFPKFLPFNGVFIIIPHPSRPQWDSKLKKEWDFSLLWIKKTNLAFLTQRVFIRTLSYQLFYDELQKFSQKLTRIEALDEGIRTTEFNSFIEKSLVNISEVILFYHQKLASIQNENNKIFELFGLSHLLDLNSETANLEFSQVFNWPLLNPGSRDHKASTIAIHHAHLLKRFGKVDSETASVSMRKVESELENVLNRVSTEVDQSINELNRVQAAREVYEEDLDSALKKVKAQLTLDEVEMERLIQKARTYMEVLSYYYYCLSSLREAQAEYDFLTYLGPYQAIRKLNLRVNVSNPSGSDRWLGPAFGKN